MNIWIDFANSPHPVFFKPIIEKLLTERHKVLITMRDFAQTVELAEKNGLKGVIIGSHGGSNRIFKLINFLERTHNLVKYTGDRKIDIAVSHNSYAQAIAGKRIGAKIITIMDYEGQPANHLAFRVAHKIIVPSFFPLKALKKFGASLDKVYRYDGFKEQLYLSEMTPNPNFINELYETCSIDRNIDITKKIIISVRTPPSKALYHNKNIEHFKLLLNTLNRKEDIIALILPRTQDQFTYIQQNFKNLYIPSRLLFFYDLIYYSDIVISAGGTMNREAAILGTPVYSIFNGTKAAVDIELAQQGRLVFLKEKNGLSQIVFSKKSNSNNALTNPNLINEITHEILN